MFYLGTVSSWTNQSHTKKGDLWRKFFGDGCCYAMSIPFPTPLPSHPSIMRSIGRRAKWMLPRQLMVFATVAIRIKINSIYRAPSSVWHGDHPIKLNLFKNYSSLPIRFIKEEKKERRTKQVISVILNITNSVDCALMLRVLFFSGLRLYIERVSLLLWQKSNTQNIHSTWHVKRNILHIIYFAVASMGLPW